MVFPNDEVVAALAFDWVGDILYLLKLNATSVPTNLQLFRVSIYDSDSLINVFPGLNELVEDKSTFQLVMDPFSGYVCLQILSEQAKQVAIQCTTFLQQTSKAWSCRDGDSIGDGGDGGGGGSESEGGKLVRHGGAIANAT